jgi:hypothetical protein
VALGAAKPTGRLWLVAGQPNCATFSSSNQNATSNFVESIPPNSAGTAPGMLGFAPPVPGLPVSFVASLTQTRGAW